MRTGLILLAAGSSERMGASKQLLEYRGRPLVRHAAAAALQSRCRPVIVVLGARASAVREALAGLPVECVENPRWAEGMGTSIQAGLRAAIAHEVDGVVLALADQPLVTAGSYDRLTAAHAASGKAIAASEYSGTVGVPAFFAAECFPELEALAPGQGCKDLILAHASAARVACPEAGTDIDTPSEYARLNAAG